MIKKIFLYASLFICLFAYSQQLKEIIVIDDVSLYPITNTHIYYSNLNEGAITNADGRAKINIRDGKIKIEHFLYKTIELSEGNFINSDTIWLSPKIMELDEVVLGKKVNFKKKLKYILKHYEELYVDYSTDKECSYKEEYLYDSKHIRLSMSQIKL